MTTFTPTTNMNCINLQYPNPTTIDCTGLINRLEFHGSGSLSVCTLTFYNGDELDNKEMESIIFTKTDHLTECILTPHKLINLSDYSYCSLKIFSGKIDPKDKVVLYAAPTS